jgi:hypothetical protein
MSGMEPMLIGAMLGGGVSAARGGNPLKGALLGAVGGGLGGAVLGAGSSAATAGMTGASAVPVGSAAGAALPAAPGVAASAPFATATMPTFAATGGSTGLIPSITAPATLMDRLSAVTKFSQENPFQMNMASNIMQQDAQRDAQRMAEMRARSGLMTGKQIPMQQQRSNFGVPQISLI